MTPSPTPDPLTDLLRATPLGAALFLAAEARTRIRQATALTPAILKLILLTLVIPAEALARRVILALAAALPAPAARIPRKALAPAAVQPAPPPRPPARVNLQPAFRMLEAQPGAGSGDTSKKVSTQINKKPAAASDPGERLALLVFRRLNAVVHALNNTESEALRFLRRRPALVAQARAPLAFGHPPGLRAAKADTTLTACLTRSDRDAATAWSRLCDTS